MADLLVSLLPLGVGVALSPLAIVAVVAVLLADRPAAKALAFLAGWVAAIVVVVVGAVLLSAGLDASADEKPPLWVPVVRLVVAAVLLGAAVWVWQRGRVHVAAMARANGPAEVAAAAPQLPGWLQHVSDFSVPRSAALGFGLCALNPADLSCLFTAGLDTRLSAVSAGTKVAGFLVFLVLGASTIAVPVAYRLARPVAAAGLLEQLRRWLASHSGVLNALVIGLLGLLQLSKGIQGL